MTILRNRLAGLRRRDSRTTDEWHVPVRPRAARSDRPRVPDDFVPLGLRVATAYSWRLLIVGAAVTVLVMLLARLRVVAVAVAAAILLAALLQPAVAALTRRQTPRGVSVAVVLGGFVGFVVAVFWLVGSAIAAQLTDLQAALAQGVAQVRNLLVATGLPLAQGGLDDLANRLITGIQRQGTGIYTGVLSTATVAAEVLGGLVLALFTTIFLLLDGEGIWRWVSRLFPQAAQVDVRESGRLAWHTLVSYSRGIIVVATFDAVFIGLALVIMDVPLALPLAVLTFFGAFIPIVGATVAGIAAVLVAFVDGGLSTALVIAAAVIAVQQIEGHLLSPLVLGRAVAVHPLGIALSIAAGGIIAGIAGAVLAVPVAAVVNTVGRYLAGARLDERLPAAATAGGAAAALEADAPPPTYPSEPDAVVSGSSGPASAEAQGSAVRSSAATEGAAGRQSAAAEGAPVHDGAGSGYPATRDVGAPAP